MSNHLFKEEWLKDIPALYSTEETPTDKKTIKLTYNSLGTTWRWHVVEAEEREGDILFFGLVEGIADEWGYFTLRQLKEVDEMLRKDSFGLMVDSFI